MAAFFLDTFGKEKHYECESFCCFFFGLQFDETAIAEEGLLKRSRKELPAVRLTREKSAVPLCQAAFEQQIKSSVTQNQLGSTDEVI